MEDCIFCKILKGSIPANIVYEDDYAVAFLDINPVNKGHTLVMSRKHFENLFDISDEILAKTMNVVKKIAIALDKISDGVNVRQNNRNAAGQLVNHVHFHVIPRFQNDGLKDWPGKKYADGEDREIAEKIKEILSS